MKNLFLCYLTFWLLQSQAQEVKTISEMRKVMMGTDLNPHLLWDTIPHTHLFGISPLGRIEGEITILDGQLFSAKVDKKGEIVIKQDWNVQAPFAVYAQVAEWEEFDFEANITNEAGLQSAIENIAQNQGYDISKAFPFRIVGKFDSLDFHIISKPKKEKKHNHDLHDKAKKHFSLQDTEGEILGFYSQHHTGIFTHRGSFLHLHYLDNAHKNMGHIEKVTFKKKVVLLLPKK